MRRRQSSLTAAGLAALRAIESLKPESDRICYDPLARRFVSPLLFHFLKFFVDIGYGDRAGPGVTEFLLARARYIDDALHTYLEEGIEQVVMLGAGYDTRAYRFDALKDDVRVFEIDHPATQQVKREKVERIFGELPRHVVYVPVDFNTETLADRLLASGYDPTLKTLFIWEGVTQYLTPDAVDATLAFIAQQSGPGSAAIFDYMTTELLRRGSDRGELRRMRRMRAVSGEGLTFGIPEGTIVTFLQARGFDEVTNADDDLLTQRYFTRSNANREVTWGYAIATARVRSG